MAFDNFARVPSKPGGIMDQLAARGPDDIVVVVSYLHYAAVVVRACHIAKDRGARILAMTDSPAAPNALQSWKTIILPMAGPQVLPSLTSAFQVAEMMLVAMACQSKDATKNVESLMTAICRTFWSAGQLPDLPRMQCNKLIRIELLCRDGVGQRPLGGLDLFIG